MNVSAGSAADASSGVERGDKKRKKKPGQVRRDQQRRTAFLERRRQAATLAEEARTNEVREEEVKKSGKVDSGAGETSSEVGKPVHEASPTRSTGCTWDVGVGAPSPGSSQQNMSIGSIEAENEPLDQAVNTVMEKKENNKWRLNVESDEIEKLEEHVKYERDSKVFKYCSSATGKISNPCLLYTSDAADE